MPSKRDLNLDGYGIGKYAYRELHNFCLRYPEMKRQLLELRNPYSSPKGNDMPHGVGIGNPTERNAEKAAELSQSTEMIEQAAIEAGEGFHQSLLVNVTNEHMSYEILCPPCGRRQFYEARRKFFFLLHLKKG